MSEFLDLDEVQRRILQLRLSSSGIGGVQGPPGTGKSLGMACEALRSVDNGQAPVVIAAFGNKTVDHVVRYARSLHIQAGGTDESFKTIACRAGYTPAISDDLLTIHSNDMLRISRAKLVFSTLHSSWRAAHAVSAERIILDETAQARPEQGFEVLENTTIDLTQNIPVTVVGDDMQARPISPGGNEFGILSRLKRSMPNSVHMLTTSYRLPEPNVDMTSSVFYEGKLDSPPEVRNRRLELRNLPLGLVRQIIDPDEPLTFVDVKGGEVEGWGYQNPSQVQLTHLIVRALRDSGLDTTDPEKLLVLAPQKAQVIETLRTLSADQLAGENVTTVTRSLGSEADVVIFQTVRSNKRGYLGMTGLREVLNVATSRSRRKLIIVGDWSTFADGFGFTESFGLFPSRSRRMADFIERQGSIVEAQPILQ